MEWRDVKGYEGYYEVSDTGRVRSVTRTNVNKSGTTRTCRGAEMRLSHMKGRGDIQYLVVNLHKNGVGKVLPVHRLVANAFIENPLNLPTVNHKDGNK